MSPKNISKPRAETRDRLIATMAELLWTKGYSAISVDTICKEAGAQKGSFYHFFASKAELAVVTCETQWEECRAELDTVFSPTRPALERFTHFLDMLYEEQVEMRQTFGYVVGCPFCTLGTELATQDEIIRKRIAIIFEAHLRYFENALRDAVAEGTLPKGTDVKTKAQELDALITGAFATARIKNDLVPVGAPLVSAVFHCLGVSRPRPRINE